MVLLALPLFTALLLTVREGRRPRYLHGVVLLLAFSAVLLFIGAERTPGQEVLWGNWLYLALTGGLFVFEMLLLRSNPAQAA
jgi:hypothetical protein